MGRNYDRKYVWETSRLLLLSFILIDKVGSVDIGPSQSLYSSSGRTYHWLMYFAYFMNNPLNVIL